MNSPSIWDVIKRRAKWLLLSPVIVALPLAIPFLILNLLNSYILIWVPFNLHSVMAADYSADSRGFRIGQLDFRIIGEIFQDHGDDNYREHLATLQASLLTPVATVTPAYPGMQITAPPSPTQTPTISTPTNIPGETQTTPTATLSPSSTPTLIPSATVRATIVYPTATKTSRPTSKPTKPPKATATKKPPPPPTSTPKPKPPTPTSVPPTKPPKPYPGPTDPPYP